MCQASSFGNLARTSEEVTQASHESRIRPEWQRWTGHLVPWCHHGATTKQGSTGRGPVRSPSSHSCASGEVHSVSGQHSTPAFLPSATVQTAVCCIENLRRLSLAQALRLSPVLTVPNSVSRE